MEAHTAEPGESINNFKITSSQMKINDFRSFAPLRPRVINLQDLQPLSNIPEQAN